VHNAHPFLTVKRNTCVSSGQALLKSDSYPVGIKKKQNKKQKQNKKKVAYHI
jgi:hypothetical protein